MTRRRNRCWLRVNLFILITIFKKKKAIPNFNWNRKTRDSRVILAQQLLSCGYLTINQGKERKQTTTENCLSCKLRETGMQRTPAAPWISTTRESVISRSTFYRHRTDSRLPAPTNNSMQRGGRGVSLSLFSATCSWTLMYSRRKNHEDTEGRAPHSLRPLLWETHWAMIPILCQWCRRLRAKIESQPHKDKDGNDVNSISSFFLFKVRRISPCFQHAKRVELINYSSQSRRRNTKKNKTKKNVMSLGLFQSLAMTGPETEGKHRASAPDSPTCNHILTFKVFSIRGAPHIRFYDYMFPWRLMGAPLLYRKGGVCLVIRGGEEEEEGGGIRETKTCLPNYGHPIIWKCIYMLTYFTQEQFTRGCWRGPHLSATSSSSSFGLLGNRENRIPAARAPGNKRHVESELANPIACLSCLCVSCRHCI